MAYSNGIITAPVSIYDVQRAIGKSSPDLGTLVTDDVVNMWSKFKPVRWNNINTIGALNNDKTWNQNAAAAQQWWKTGGNYGIYIPFVNFTTNYRSVRIALESIANSGNIDGGLNGWEYLKPRGNYANPAEPYRLLDFLQYYHAAARPIFSAHGHSVRGRIDGDYSISVELGEANPDQFESRFNLVPQDLTSETLIRGLAIYYHDTDGYHCIGWCTGEEWQGNGIYDTLNYSEPSSGSYATTHLGKREDLRDPYYVLPVFFTKELAQTGRDRSMYPTVAGKVAPFPYCPLIAFLAIQTQRTIRLSNHVIDTNRNFSSNLSLCNTASAFTAAFETAIVNEGFTGQFAEGNYIMSTYQTSSSFNFPQNASVLESTQFATFNVINGALTSGHDWSVYANIDGTVYYERLIQPASPI